MTFNTLLSQRNKAKKKQPAFVVRESNFSARVKKRWRFPQGRHSPIRQVHRGRPVKPHPGYGSPKEVYGLSYSGLRPVVVHTIKELSALDVKRDGAILGRTLSKKTRLTLLRLAQEKNISLLNVKDGKVAIVNIEKWFSEKKKVKSEKESTKRKKEEERKKRATSKKEAEKQAQSQKEPQKENSEQSPSIDEKVDQTSKQP